MRAVVIGGGINGIMTSYFLSKKADVTLIEKNKELLSEASAINASLLMFKPNFNIYSFPPTYSNIYNSFLINPRWCFNYVYNAPFQDTIDETQQQLATLSKKESEQFKIPLYQSVYEDRILLDDVYILNCRKFGLNLIDQLKQSYHKHPVKVITNNAATGFIHDKNEKQIKSVILSDGTEIETDVVIICTAHTNKFPIMKVYGKAKIDYDYKPLEIRSEIDHYSGMVITFDDDSQRVCQGAIISAEKPTDQLNSQLFNTHFRAVTPDGLPIIDQNNKVKNLYYNLGHGFLGWTWSFASGKLISSLIFEGDEVKKDPLLIKLKGSRFW